LVDLYDLWDDNGHGEVFLDQVFVQVQGRLDELLIVVPVVPDVKFAVKGISLFRVFLFLEFEQRLTILQTNGIELLPQVIKELYKTPDVSRLCDRGLARDTYGADIISSFNHLHLRDIVRPRGISEKLCDPAT